MEQFLIITSIIFGVAILNQALFTYKYYKTPRHKRGKYAESFELMWGGLAPRR